jgi:hypothetical protein
MWGMQAADSLGHELALVRTIEGLHAQSQFHRWNRVSNNSKHGGKTRHQANLYIENTLPVRV